MSDVFEVVGAVDAAVETSALHPRDDVILVEQEDGDYLLARPKSGGDDA